MAAPLGCVKRNPVFLYVAEGSKGTEKLWGTPRSLCRAANSSGVISRSPATSLRNLEYGMFAIG